MISFNLQKESIAALKKMLNSDRIQHFFGSYGVQVLEVPRSVFPGCRISNLHSLHNHQKIMRTLAIVDYHNPRDPRLEAAHQTIVKGTSIGTALRDAGWILIKQPIYFGEICLSQQVREWMQEKDNDKGAIHIYQLNVKCSEQDTPIPYCQIIEIHSPQYLTLACLKVLHDSEYPNHHQTDANISCLLRRVADQLSAFSVHPTLTMAFDQQKMSKGKACAPDLGLPNSARRAAL